MASNSRPLIRTAIAECISEVVDYPVYASRNIDGCDEDEFCNVFLVDGDAEFQGLIQQNVSNLVVAYRTKDEFTDDEIDLKASAIEQAIASAEFGDVMSGIFRSGFEYLEERERDFDGINLRYTVYY